MRKIALRYSNSVLLVALIASATAAAAAGGPSHRHAIDVASPWQSGAYVYDGAGNIVQIGADTYTYDRVGRLTKGTVDGPLNWQDYTYDSYGNWLSATTHGKPCVDQPCGGTFAADPVTNRLTGANVLYDGAGNLVQYDPNFDPAKPSSSKPFLYSFDGAGMIDRVEAPGDLAYEYVYTASDERLGTAVGSKTDMAAGATWHFTVRGPDEKVIREVDAYVGSNGTTWSWSRDQVFRNGVLLASVSRVGSEQFHVDHLGTPRVVTDGFGGWIGSHTYYPFGEEQLTGDRIEDPEEPLKLTGHERDPIGSSSLDYMHARFFSARVGRFLSPDPKIGSVGQPSTWNRFAYVENNPLNRVDPTGLQDARCADKTVCASNDSMLVLKIAVGMENKGHFLGRSALKATAKVELDVANMDVKAILEAGLDAPGRKDGLMLVKKEYSIRKGEVEELTPERELSFKVENIGFTIKDTEVSVSGPALFPHTEWTVGVNPAAIKSTINTLRQMPGKLREFINWSGSDPTINPGGNLGGRNHPE